MLALTIIVWILSAMLAALNIMAGLMKVITGGRGEKPMPALLDYPASGIRLLGAAEILGGIAVVVAPLFGFPFWLLAPIAALALSLVQVFAIGAHRKHGEPITMNIRLLVLGLVVAALRFVVAPY